MPERPFALPNRELVTVRLDLPVPPSVNATRRVDWAGQRATAQWKQAADRIVMATPPRERRAIPGRFEIRITLSEQHTRCDADNVLKTLIDYLRRIELIVNDSPKYMRRIVVEWGTAPEGCRVQLTELADA